MAKYKPYYTRYYLHMCYSGEGEFFYVPCWHIYPWLRGYVIHAQPKKIPRRGKSNTAAYCAAS